MKNPLLHAKATTPEVQDYQLLNVSQIALPEPATTLAQLVHTAKPSELDLSKKYPVLHLVAVEGVEAVVSY